MSTKEKAKIILKLLLKNYPDAKISLNYSNNFELLIAVMLSAQTTDVQVNKVTKNLFKKYQKLNKKYKKDYSKYLFSDLKKNEYIEIVNFADVKTGELEKEIHSIGLYKTKAKNIRMVSQIILKNYKGIVPNKLSELIKLPGVGRKTANVVLWNAYGVIEGVAVDTHVKRLAQRYGLAKEKTPEKIEKELMGLFEKKDWPKITPLLVEHGRKTNKTKKDFILLQNL